MLVRQCALPLALVSCLGVPSIAAEIIVPTQMPLSIAIAVAANDDIITLLPSGSPYQNFPGLAVSGKRITIRGSTGNPDDVVIDGAGLDIVLRMTNCDGSLLQDLTLRNGRGATATDSSGAGLWLSGSDITIRNCVIRDNFLPAPDGNGAGIYGFQSSVVIDRCVIRDNVIASGLADGVGVYLNQGNHTIIDTQFIQNITPSNIVLTDTSFGGGFYNDNGRAFLTRCEFRGNRAGFGGGVGVAGSSSLVVDACVFADNVARFGGGLRQGASTSGDPLIVRNSLFVGNQALVNDAAINTDKNGSLTNLTCVNNTATGSYILGGSPPTGLQISNCIVWGNTYTTSNGLFPASTPDIVRNSILQQTYTGAPGSGSNIIANPLFVNAAARDFSLSAASPAIDAGDSRLYVGPFTDLIGGIRGVDDPTKADTGFSITGPVIDIGAYESQVPCNTGPNPGECSSIDFNNDGLFPDESDLISFLSVLAGGPCL